MSDFVVCPLFPKTGYAQILAAVRIRIIRFHLLKHAFIGLLVTIFRIYPGTRAGAVDGIGVPGSTGQYMEYRTIIRLLQQGIVAAVFCRNAS